MRIQRAARRRRTPWLGCGCVGIAVGIGLVGLVAVIVIVPALPGLAARLAGLTPRGSTDALFVDAPLPAVQVENPFTPPDAVVTLGDYGQVSLSADAGYYSVITGFSDGAPVAVVSFTENSLMDLCYQRADLCSGAGSSFRNARLDLRPGGAVVYADLLVPGMSIWQPVGVALRLDSARRQFVVAGVDLGGTLYDLPQDALGEQVTQLAGAGNDLLRRLELEAGGGRYGQPEVVIDDGTLTLVLR
jgi:hypothetical protein